MEAVESVFEEIFVGELAAKNKQTPHINMTITIVDTTVVFLRSSIHFIIELFVTDKTPLRQKLSVLNKTGLFLSNYYFTLSMYNITIFFKKYNSFWFMWPCIFSPLSAFMHFETFL